MVLRGMGGVSFPYRSTYQEFSEAFEDKILI
jgi:hypothetical protein